MLINFLQQNLSPEEEHRRRLRRERNKQAAARCRKRRMDQTNELLKQTEQLEDEKRRLQKDLQDLQSYCQELESCLSQHECSVVRRPSSVRTLGKLNNNHVQVIQSQQTHSNRKPSRPSSLPLAGGLFGGNKSIVSNPVSTASHGQETPNILAIQTPSNGIFSLEGLMDGSTGLTPLLATPSAGGFLSTPSSCSGQTRSDVTPTDNGGHKLVSL